MSGLKKYSCEFPVFHAAPTAPPGPVSVLGFTSTSITIQWGLLSCINQNGNITGYSVRYGTVGSELREIVTVEGSTITSHPLTGLNSSTTYSVEVAAVNGAGIGVYSGPINQTTLGELVSFC